MTGRMLFCGIIGFVSTGGESIFLSLIVARLLSQLLMLLTADTVIRIEPAAPYTQLHQISLLHTHTSLSYHPCQDLLMKLIHAMPTPKPNLCLTPKPNLCLRNLLGFFVCLSVYLSIKA